MAQKWTDRIVSAQIAVNDRFADRLQHSQLSRQEWGLVRSAVDFEIKHPNDPDRARIIAKTQNLSTIMPKLIQIAEMTSTAASHRTGSSSIFDAVKTALGLNDSVDALRTEKRDQAEQLAAAYAADLQRYLEHNGKWDAIRASVRGAEDTRS